MKILIISQETWTTQNNGGNVLSNLFEGFDAEFAQIYCSPGLPNNNVCKKYYQVTDMMMLKKMIGKQNKIGEQYVFSNFPNSDQEKIAEDEKENKFYSFFKRHHWLIFDIAREFVWKISNWKNKSLEQFVTDFNPDLIFAPCYGSHYMLAMTRHVATLSKANIISYISDDSYSLRQFRWSPLFWIYRFSLRNALRKTFAQYSLTYTMTEEQQNELTKSLNAKMKILRKGAVIAKALNEAKEIHSPLQVVYAGNLYCGRSNTLEKIVEVFKAINKNNVEIELKIYTNSIITKELKEALHDGRSSFLNSAISQTQLKEIYTKSDIVLHVESFNIKDRLTTRLSFSTKIVDCLGSGCAVMAICWEGHSGLIYLKKEDAAICVDNIKNIEATFRNVVNNRNIILEYRAKAIECLKRNHSISEIQESLQQDFVHYSSIK